VNIIYILKDSMFVMCEDLEVGIELFRCVSHCHAYIYIYIYIYRHACVNILLLSLASSLCVCVCVRACVRACVTPPFPRPREQGIFGVKFYIDGRCAYTYTYTYIQTYISSLLTPPPTHTHTGELCEGGAAGGAWEPGPETRFTHPPTHSRA
jgi:hypothetical protein